MKNNDERSETIKSDKNYRIKWQKMYIRVLMPSILTSKIFQINLEIITFNKENIKHFINVGP